MARRLKRAKLKNWKKREARKINLELSPETKEGILIIFLFAFSFISILSFFNIAGPLGGKILVFLKLFWGWAGYVVPIILLSLAYVLLRKEKYQPKFSNYLGLVIFILSLCGLAHLTINPNAATQTISSGQGGGYFGFIVSSPLQKLLGFWATMILLMAVLIVSLLLTLNPDRKKIFERIKAWRERARERRFGGVQEVLPEKEPFTAKDLTEIPETEAEAKKVKEKQLKEMASTPSSDRQPALLSLPKTKAIRRKVDLPLEFLESSGSKPTAGNIEVNKEKIQKALKNFGIEVEMGPVNVGPTVTQYTLRPAEGVKLSHILTLQNDLALALAAHPIRIEAPIPGKSLVGVEVPNQAVAIVTLKEIITSEEFKNRRSNLTVCLGIDVAGKPWVANLESMPHLLIAGATGSGKSVCINSIIVSLLYQNNPEDIKFILIDPKRVEFNQYNGIPHLLTPVITDLEKTINALKWAIIEMDRRYELLSKNNKRNIQEYNQTAEERMPWITIIIDELADLMAAAPRDVEAAIIRLAQMSRATGIHLVIATQRPSVDIITGLIKANITSRIAFAVASLVDSRTILDHSGAEKLLGKGDMLYVSAQLSKPKRLQGVKVIDQEIKKITDYLKEQAPPDYDEVVTTKQSVQLASGNYIASETDDPLLAEAKEVIIQAGKASASLLQRRLRIGYARAARLLDLMEAQGMIGPADGAKPREILTTEASKKLTDENEDIFSPEKN